MVTATLKQDLQQQCRNQSNPHLTADSVFRCSEVCLDHRVLLELFEEELHLPSLAVKLCNRFSRAVEIIRNEFKLTIFDRIEVPNHPPLLFAADFLGGLAGKGNVIVGPVVAFSDHGAFIERCMSSVLF